MTGKLLIVLAPTLLKIRKQLGVVFVGDNAVLLLRWLAPDGSMFHHFSPNGGMC